MDFVGKFRGRETQKCPRCGEKCLMTQSVCPECGLVFSRLEYVTNTDARKRLKHGEKNNVLWQTKIPYDIKYWKLLVYSILLGLFGAHYFYVYRWKMGIYMLVGILMTVCFGVVFNAYTISWWNGNFMNYIVAPFVGVYAIVWLFSIVQVIFRKFKIPVALPYKEFKIVEEKEI